MKKVTKMEKIIDIFNTTPNSFNHHLELDKEFDLWHEIIIKKEYNMETFDHLIEYWNFLNKVKPKSFSNHLRFERYKASCNEKINTCAMHICFLKYKRFKLEYAIH